MDWHQAVLGAVEKAVLGAVEKAVGEAVEKAVGGAVGEVVLKIMVRAAGGVVRAAMVRAAEVVRAAGMVRAAMVGAAGMVGTVLKAMKAMLVVDLKVVEKMVKRVVEEVVEKVVVKVQGPRIKDHEMKKTMRQKTVQTCRLVSPDQPAGSSLRGQRLHHTPSTPMGGTGMVLQLGMNLCAQTRNSKANLNILITVLILLFSNMFTTHLSTICLFRHFCSP